MQTIAKQVINDFVIRETDRQIIIRQITAIPTRCHCLSVLLHSNTKTSKPRWRGPDRVNSDRRHGSETAT